MQSCKLFTRRASALALCGYALCASAWSIVWRHDRDSNLYVQLATQPQFAGVGFLTDGNGFGSGTLIADGSWVLTAAHVVDGITNPSELRFVLSDNEFYTAQAIFIHPDWTGNLGSNGDIALVRLSQRVSSAPRARLFTGGSLVGRIGYSVGFGLNGDGNTGYNEWLGGRFAMTNQIDLLGETMQDLPSDIFLSDFDHPDGTTNTLAFAGSDADPLELEGMGAPGDSGGGVFILVDGEWYLAGVHSFLADLGPPIGNSNPDARYGDVLGSVRVDYHINWINATVPEPASMTALALGLLGLLKRRRKR